MTNLNQQQEDDNATNNSTEKCFEDIASSSSSSIVEEQKQKNEKGDDEYDDMNMTTADVIAPQYQPILCLGDEDDEEDDYTGKPRRQMLGYAAYHGPKFIPAEIKDNMEHFLANNPMPGFVQKFFGRVFLGRDDVSG